MALIKCKNCGKDISDKANHCPHCSNVYRKKNFTKIWLIIAICCLIISIMNIYIFKNVIMASSTFNSIVSIITLVLFGGFVAMFFIKRKK